ncbi:hypothetical protein LCGC14_0316750 [marine sediment metagenome]|uniref:Uncharacterized protein n=1 Tax=marine sediment metagenome TaxID=412755 RepID=A0A0F9WSK2_9ZZZZ
MIKHMYGNTIEEVCKEIVFWTKVSARVEARLFIKGTIKWNDQKCQFEATMHFRSTH